MHENESKLEMGFKSLFAIIVVPETERSYAKAKVIVKLKPDLDLSNAVYENFPFVDLGWSIPGFLLKLWICRMKVYYHKGASTYDVRF